jgi:hypothetical protein
VLRSVPISSFPTMLTVGSEAFSPMQRLESFEGEGPAPGPQRAALANSKAPSRIAVPAMASRMSIERYLSAPLSDEAATAPAIDAALRRHIPRDWIDSPGILYHSRETSVDVHSDGRPPFFTSGGSNPDTVDTRYTVDSRPRPPPILKSPDPNGQSSMVWTRSDSVEVVSPNRPDRNGTIGPVDIAREWAEKVEKHLPSCRADTGIDHRAKAEEEIARIQEKARELELMMRRFKIERVAPEPKAPKMTDEAARVMMAANPKLAWILGGETIESRSIARPKTTTRTTDDIPDSPSSFGKAVQDASFGRIPRKSKSSSALKEETHHHASDVPDVPKLHHAIDQQLRARSRFYCTFCQKRLHSQAEWLRHERSVHMPEELWVCCPRTGEFPTRCPFCEKTHPSPAHLADHNYLSCQEKPLSKRTFARKDQFLQHISQVHRVSPGQKPARLAELELAWRHPLPDDISRQALHCGFCGEDFDTYQERTLHVARHFAEGADMMSWWRDRVSHNVDAGGITSYP